MLIPFRARPAVLLAITIFSLIALPSQLAAQRELPQAAGALMVEPAPGDGVRHPGSRSADHVSLIVQLQGPTLLAELKRHKPHARLRAQLDTAAGRDQVRRIAREHAAFERALRARVPDARIHRNLQLAINGVALSAPPAQIAAIRAMPGVRAVWTDTRRHLQTTRAPALIGATAAWAGAGGAATTGDGVVIGVIDSGIWPEHPSFADPGPDGSYTAPQGWSGTACEFGLTPGDAAFACTNKIVGARRMMVTYDQQHALQPGEFASARDDLGHGTLVSTVAAGNRNVPGQIRGNPIGATAGVAPHARLAVYKVCGRAGCYDSDAVAAIEQAIADGVDVLSIALSGGRDPYDDPLSLALLDAHDAGIFVAAPAGNSGFGALTGRREPWTTVVGATRLDRAFVSTLTLRAGTITATLFGTSVTTGIAAPTPIVDAAAIGDPNCLAASPANLTGAVVICSRGGNSRTDKSRNVQLRGGAGMILTNPTPSDLQADNHFVPSLHLDKASADALSAFLKTHGSAARASFTAGSAFNIPGESIASFTSLGAAGQPLSISKPDLVAPGVYVAGGHSAAPPAEGGPSGESFQVVDGTSISAAHVVGGAALLKALHPTWSPDHIRSALMLTAATAIANASGQQATSFEMGAGRINVALARSPGLAILPEPGEFIAKRERLWDVNYPAVYVARMPGVIVGQRVLTNLENRQTTWSIQVSSSGLMRVTTLPSVTVPALGTTTLPLVLDGVSVPFDSLGTATVTLTEVGGTRQLRIPIAVLRKPDALPVSVSCSPATIRVSQTSECSITVANLSPSDTAVTVYDTLPGALQLVSGSVVNGSSGGNTVYHQPTLAAAIPGSLDVRVFPPWEGFLSLSTYYAPIACSGSCDDRVFTAAIPQGILFNGEVHTSISISTNGFLQFGTDGVAAPVNQALPNAATPNGVLAPFWTDLHPAGTDGQGGGRMYAGYLMFPSGRNYLAIEWNNVEVKGSPARHTFQIWLQVGGQVEDVSYSYERLESLGAGALLTVGAENGTGTVGKSYFFNGTGVAPAPQSNLFISSPGPAPGGAHTMTFRVRGMTAGTFSHCAVVTRTGSTDYGAMCIPVVVQP